jgi:hypothetical protein
LGTQKEVIMNTQNLKQSFFTASFLLALALLSLLLIPYIAANQDAESSQPDKLTMTETTVISGTFQGTVAITVPVPLGVLDFAFALSDEGGVLSGTMNNEYTLVFDGTPNLRGSVDTTPMTPTFRLASEPFSGQVSGRQVERSFTLEGEAVENGEVLQGIYSEVITGFTPKPMVMEGLFMLTRPSDAPENTTLLTLSTTPTTVATAGSATVTATVVDQDGLPLSGVEVSFSANLGSISPASMTTNGSGRAIATFTAGDMPGLAHIVADCCDGLSQSTSVQIESPDSDGLTLEIADATLEIGAETTVTATVQDQFNNPLSGIVVTFQGTLGTVSPGSAVTNNNGQVNATFSAGSQSGQATITALAGTATASANIQINEASGDPTISDAHTSNVRDVTFTVSWLTDIASAGEIHYGTDANNLNLTAGDRRGAATNSQTHYVEIGNLLPNSTYYFDIVSGNTTDNNEGTHYQVTTGTTLGVPGSDLIFGELFKEDGTTHAAGTIVYITLEDGNGAGSPASAALLSALVENNGFWSTNLRNVRLADLSDYFSYSASGDQLLLVADGAADGHHCGITVDTANDAPVPDMLLSHEPCTISWTINLAAGWNKVALPLSLATPLTAEELCTQIADEGGSIAEIDRWHQGGWSGHACGYPFNDFEIELGVGYFIKANSASDWTIEGSAVSTPVALSLQVGWNSISLPHTEGYNAESLCDDIISQGVTAIEIDRWHNGGWDGHLCGYPFNDFALERGKGYFVKTSSSGTVTPPVLAGSVTPSELAGKRKTLPLPPISPDDIPTGKTMLVRDLHISNLNDTSVTFSWTTDEATTGYVRFGSEERVAYDNRSAATSSTTHDVVLDKLTPETTYHFEIVSGAEVGESGSISTLSSLESVPESDSIYGQLFWSNGTTPAAGRLVYLTLQDADGAGSEGEGTLLSAFTDENGYWHANLGNARLAESGEAFSYSATGDEVVLTVQSGTDSSTTITLDTSSLRPAAPIILEETALLRLYLPLIGN